MRNSGRLAAFVKVEAWRRAVTLIWLLPLFCTDNAAHKSVHFEILILFYFYFIIIYFIFNNILKPL